MEKWSIEKMTEYWNLWEIRFGESFIDYFVDDYIHNMGIVVGFFCGRFPELGKYILEASNYKVPWTYIQDWITKKEPEKDIPSISHLVELFYEVENEEGIFDKNRYAESVYAWCTLIHDIDAYYNRFIEWVEKNNDEELTQELNNLWKEK